MGSFQTLICVKKVTQDVPEEWDETMPLPGDIIEGIAEEDGDEFFMTPKGKAELSSQLGKVSRQAESIWIKVRRGDATLRLRACVVPERASKLQRRYTIRAASDDRHVVELGDCTLNQITELQEKSRTVVNVNDRGFNMKEMKYDWKKKVGTYLPDHRSTIISSILFMPLAGEHTVGSTTSRSMAWFSAAVSFGAPLVFVNIQTEQVVTSEKTTSGVRELIWGRQQSLNTTLNIVQGIRLWFMPGVAELQIVLTAEPGETRFGMDIKRTEEGFICVNTVAKGLAADRAGLKQLQEEALETGHRVMISRLEGKSLMPCMVSSTGLIRCSDNVEVKKALTSAIDNMECISLHVMAWPNHNVSPHAPQHTSIATLEPPSNSCQPTYNVGHSCEYIVLDEELGKIDSS